ncbi:MAG: S-layer homology domain-containing protein [Clostridia bacterium]|nr:S-layer homology domain-containing protein [Clostridia bacterium]
MRKITALILSIIIFSLGAVSVTADGNNIEGLKECMDALWMKNYYTEKQFAEMREKRKAEYTDEFWRTPWETRRNLEWRYIKYPDDAEAELSYRIETRMPDPDDSLWVTWLNDPDMNYCNVYAQNGVFDYIFSDTGYWTYYRKYSGSVMRTDGTFLKVRTANKRETYISIYSDSDELDFIKDINGIADLLGSAGVKTVYDVKIFGTGFMSSEMRFLYFKCDNGDYLIRLSTTNTATDQNVYLPIMERFQLYTAKEAMQKISDVYLSDNHDEREFGLKQAKSIAAVKPTFEEEAEALQQAGLLQGNEKGLDLLKPLSRIEATALLVRALGLENEPAAEQSEFADIPNGHWGVKYANIAAEKGITKGVGNNEFAPNSLVTDNQFATLVLRSANESDFNWETAIETLTERGIITPEDASTMDLFTRGDAAKIIYEAREKGLLR